MGCRRSLRIDMQTEWRRCSGGVRMKRRFLNLPHELKGPWAIPEGLYLVTLKGVAYFGRRKPFYQLQFRVLQPERWTDRVFSARLYCTTKAVSKLLWFL